MPLELRSKDKALRAVLEGKLQAGLLDAEMLELTDERYKRQDVVMAPETENVYADEYANAYEVRFPGVSEETTVAGWCLYDADDFRVSWEEFEKPLVVRARERVFFEAGALVVRLEG